MRKFDSGYGKPHKIITKYDETWYENFKNERKSHSGGRGTNVSQNVN